MDREPDRDGCRHRPWASRKPFGWALGLIAAPIAATGLVDLVQERHSLRRNYPVLARFRWLAEDLRPELRQYFVESDTDGAPFDRNERTYVYEQAKDAHATGEGGISPYHRQGGDLVMDRDRLLRGADHRRDV